MDSVSQDILRALQDIPTGKVMTYKTMADKFWVHPRKVAMTMKYNPRPDLYPCYKIISHSGKISGYSGDGGVQSKQEKLEAEGIEIIDGKIDAKYIV